MVKLRKNDPAIKVASAIKEVESALAVFDDIYVKVEKANQQLQEAIIEDKQALDVIQRRIDQASDELLANHRLLDQLRKFIPERQGVVDGE